LFCMLGRSLEGNNLIINILWEFEQIITNKIVGVTPFIIADTGIEYVMDTTNRMNRKQYGYVNNGNLL
jgi:hypothetical protein